MSRLRRARRLWRLEKLEPRTLLAGNVTVSLRGNDDLVIRGDAVDNTIAITFAANDTTVTGVGTTINGAGVPFLAGRQTRNIIIDLGDGSDTLAVSSGTLAGNLIVRTGKGNDTVNLGDTVAGAGDGPLTIDRNMTIDAGQGNDTILARAVNIQRRGVIFGGSENDTVNFSNGLDATALGVEVEAMVVNLGSGDNTLNAAFGPPSVATEVLSVGAALTVVSGAGIDTVNLDSAGVDDRLLIQTGAEQDTVSLQDLDCDLAVINTGADDDSLSLQAGRFDRLKVNLGSGDDTLSFGDLDVDVSASFDGSSGSLDQLTDNGGNTFGRRRDRRFEI